MLAEPNALRLVMRIHRWDQPEDLNLPFARKAEKPFKKLEGHGIDPPFGWPIGRWGGDWISRFRSQEQAPLVDPPIATLNEFNIAGGGRAVAEEFPVVRPDFVTILE